MSEQKKCCATCGWVSPDQDLYPAFWCDKKGEFTHLGEVRDCWDPPPTPKIDRAGMAELYGLSPATRAALQPPTSDEQLATSDASTTEGVEI